jgi:ABC-type multidrug transport system fused ATPase/permease subunit
VTSPLRLAWGLLRPHTAALIAAALLAAVIAACRGALVWLVRDVLDALLKAGDPAATRWLPGAVIALFAVQGGARVARTLLTRRAALQAESALRLRLFGVLLALPPADLQRLGRGEAMSRLIHDCGKVRTAVGAAVTSLQRPLSAAAVLGSAVFMAPRLAGWAALGLPVVAAVVVGAGRATRGASKVHLEALGRLQARLRDALEGARTVQAYGAEGRALADVAADEDAQVDAALRSHGAQVVGPPVVELVAAIAFALVLAVGGAEVQRGDLSPGSLFAFLVALGLLNEPLKGIAQAWGLWQDATAGLDRVAELIEREVPAADPGGRLPPGPLHLDLVGVSVDRGRGPVLQGLDLSLRPGELVVVVGPSGAGKSTLLDVLGGFVEPSAGEVRWNGVPDAAIALRARRAAIAWVDQHPWLGAGTVAEAVRLGRPDASDDEVRAALAAAGLEPDGGVVRAISRAGDAVGDGGEPLSGGEQQRIAIARALLRGAPLLLLDEPTAHLDPATEQAFLDTLSSLRPGRVLVLVTHRAAPLARASRAYRLEEGRLLALDRAEAAS